MKKLYVISNIGKEGKSVITKHLTDEEYSLVLRIINKLNEHRELFSPSLMIEEKKEED